MGPRPPNSPRPSRHGATRPIAPSPLRAASNPARVGVPDTDRTFQAFQRIGISESKYDAAKSTLAKTIKDFANSGIDSHQHSSLLRTYGDLLDGYLFPEEQCAEALVTAKELLEELDYSPAESTSAGNKITNTLRALDDTIATIRSPTKHGRLGEGQLDFLGQAPLSAEQIGEEINFLKQRIEKLQSEKDKQETLADLMPFLVDRTDDYILYNHSTQEKLDTNSAPELQSEAYLPAELRTFIPLGHEAKVLAEIEGLRELELAVEEDPDDGDALEALRSKLVKLKRVVDNTILMRLSGAELESTTSRVVEVGTETLTQAYEVAWQKIELEEIEALQECRSVMKCQITENQARDKAVQTTTDVTVLYSHAAKVKRHFGVIMKSIQKECGGLLLISGMKGAARIVEKIMLRPDSPGSANLVMDVNRCMHICKSVREIIACIKAFHSCVSICIVQSYLADNMTHTGRWTNFVINFFLNEDPNRHICEAVITHQKIVAARRDLKGGEIDLFVRSARELLGLHNNLKVADVETSALKKFFENTCGRSWNKCKNWATEAALDEWHGLSTDDMGQVHVLELPNNALDGDLAALGALTECKALSCVDVSRNQALRGNVRSLIQLTSLSSLSLKGCPLVMGSCAPLKELIGLQKLDISHTAMDGTFETFCDLGRLKALDIRGTNIDCSSALDLLMMWASSLPTSQSDALIRAVQGKFENELGPSRARASQKIDEALVRLQRLSGREYNTDEAFAPDGSQWILAKGAGLVEAQVEKVSEFTLVFPLDEHGDVVAIEEEKFMVKMASLLTNEEKVHLKNTFLKAVQSSSSETAKVEVNDAEVDMEIYAEGTLDKELFIDVVNKLSQEAGGRLQSIDRLERVFTEADVDGSDTIDLQEFLDLYAKVKKGDGPKGLTGPRSARPVDDDDDGQIGYTDSTGNISNVRVNNQGDGSVLVQYIPAIDGMVELSVEIAGVPVRGSPFQFYVMPPPLRFKWTSFENIKLSNNSCIAENTDQTDFRYAIAWPSLPNDKTLLWRIRVLKVGGGCYLGIIGGNHKPHNSAFDTHDAFVWQSGGNVFIGGEPNKGHQGWTGFKEGDEPLFRYDPSKETLYMQIERGGNLCGSYSVRTGPCPPEGFRVLANFRCFGYCKVELLTATDLEWQDTASKPGPIDF